MPKQKKQTMRYFKQSIRITPNKMYAAAPIFKGRSQVEFGGQRITMAMRNRNEMYNVKEYVDGMPTFIHQFDGVTPLMIDFKWEIDPNTNKIKESDKQKREAAVLNFLKFHENIVWKKDIDSLGNISKSAGNVNLKKALFIIEILEDTLNNEIQRWEKELKVRCIVNDMTEEQRVELCYFYGLNPNGMIDGETKVALAGKSGVAVNNENIDDFLDMMQNKGKEIHGVLNKVIFNKALVDGVIRKQDGVYISDGGLQIGMSEAEAISYLETNSSFKDMISKRLNQSRVLFLEKIKAEQTAVIETDLNILNKPFDVKKQWAKDNGVPYIHNITDDDKLTKKIKEFIVASGLKVAATQTT